MSTATANRKNAKLIFDKEECVYRLTCLTTNVICACSFAPAHYTFDKRLGPREVALHYIKDVCIRCKRHNDCKKKNYRMKFRGTSDRNGMWTSEINISGRAYPLFQWRVRCRKFNPKFIGGVK